MATLARRLQRSAQRSPAAARLLRPRWASTVAVSHADAGLPDLIITPLAARKLVEAADKQQTPGLMLRVAVEGGGCSGFKYVYEFERSPPSEDEDV